MLCPRRPRWNFRRFAPVFEPKIGVVETSSISISPAKVKVTVIEVRFLMKKRWDAQREKVAVKWDDWEAQC